MTFASGVFADATAESTAVQEPLPPCPFTRLGLDAEGMSRCPGFVPDTRGITEIEPWEVEFGF